LAKDKPAPIIRKIIKKYDAPHGGGAWKVAYADFVTAMMAFFLLMWLVNSATEEQKQGISEYFGPIGQTVGPPGNGGIFSGQSSRKTLVSRGQSATKTVGKSSQSAQKSSGKIKDLQHDAQGLMMELEKIQQGNKPFYEKKIRKLLNDIDKKAFEETEDKLRIALSEENGLKNFSKNILIDQSPKGLRIQIIDQENRSMFPLGSSDMHDYTRKIVRRLAQIITPLPNKILIEGHTDALPYSSEKGYTNWELSADRANSTRQMLQKFGVPNDRIAYVVGNADNDLLMSSDPYSPQNRRISITLMKTNSQDTDPSSTAPLQSKL